MKKTKKQNPRTVRIAMVLLALFVVVLAGLMYWETHIYPQQLRSEAAETAGQVSTTLPAQKPVPDTVPEMAPPTEATMPTLAADSMNGKKVLNVLITGQDRLTEDSWGRSDAMLLCSINAETDTVTIVSFLRDLHLKIPGHGSNRLNAAYSWGGAELLNETLTKTFGVHIDGNIEIDFQDFIALIDFLGGVDMELTAREAEYLNEHQSGASEEPWALTEGENHLSGAQALLYSRIRKIDSDFARTERQRKVLMQVMQKLQELDWNELQDAMGMLLENSHLSFTSEELLLYTLGFYPVLMDSEIVTSRIPADGTWEYATVSGRSVIKANLDQNAEILQELLNGFNNE